MFNRGQGSGTIEDGSDAHDSPRQNFRNGAGTADRRSAGSCPEHHTTNSSPRRRRRPGRLRRRPPARTSGESETRPATTTFEGDTGLWFVPTGEVLPAKKWSFSGYRVNFDRDQGFTDVSNWPVTAGHRPGGSGRALWRVHGRPPDRPRRPAGVRGDAAARRRPGQRVSVRAARLVRQPARGPHDWREDQPAVRVAAAAGRAGAARAGEAADGEGRRRRRRDREDGLQFRRGAEQGDQPAGRALRLCRLHLARRSVGGRSE